MNERTGPAGAGHDTLMWEVAAAPGRHTELMAALFPPVSSDLLTFYVP